MNKNEKFVITINREMGSGGRSIGRALAEKLKVPFYDKAIINTMQEKYQISVDEIEAIKGRKHDWWSDLKRSFALGQQMMQSQYRQVKPGEGPDALTTDKMFAEEQETLLRIASSGSCVIAGRTAFHIFRNHPNHLSILITAPMEQRVIRIMKKQGVSQDQALKTINEVDQMRENYVQKYTGTTRYDARLYDLVISMKEHSEAEVVDLILSYCKAK
jgi:cytidylate kinase